MLIKLLRIQADGKLPQRLVSPMSRHKWFPTYHCTTLQHDQKIAKGHDLLDELFLCEEKKLAKIHDKAGRHITFMWPISERVKKLGLKYRVVCLDTPLRSFSVSQSVKKIVLGERSGGGILGDH